jgi:AcrR family transcriptional regulator
MAATLAELAAHGVEGLSVERIALAAELNKTSVYRRWPTRDALVVAALGHVLEDLSLEIVDTGTLRGDAAALVAAVAAFVEQPVGRALLRASLSVGPTPEIAALARRQLEGSAAGAAAALVARAVERREWRADAAPEIAFSLLIGAVLHRVALERAPATPEWQAAVVSLFLRGVSGA